MLPLYEKKGVEMTKIDLIRKWMDETQYEVLLIARRDNYAWITQGDRSYVLTTEPLGVAIIIISKSRIEVVADNSDLSRMVEEENKLKAVPVLVPWYQNKQEYIQHYLSGQKVASDYEIEFAEYVQPRLIELRMQLSASQQQCYREIGFECAKVVEDICTKVQKGESESAIANRLKQECIRKGISPDCVLIGSDERIIRYRHPMPTDKAVRNSLMVVLGGEKQGLNVSLTRMVYFDEIPDSIRIRYKKIQNIFADMQFAMAEGTVYSSYFSMVKELYEQAGYPQEWKNHHQGGPTGYSCREVIVNQNTENCIRKNQAYAWNPSIGGVKCEETTLLNNGGEVEVLTNTGTWPRSKIIREEKTIEIVDILVL